MKISIAGDLGSGKSSVARILSGTLGFGYISTGQLHRKIAEEYGVNSLELNKIAGSDYSVDDRIDTYLSSLNNAEEDLIIDSRLAWHFVMNTFKVYLEVHSEIGAERVLSDRERMREPIYANREKALYSLRARKQAENDRFLIKYGVRCDDLSNYDVLINTSDSSTAETSKLIMTLIDCWRHGPDFERFWISPRFLFPTEHVRSLSRVDAKTVTSRMSTVGFDNHYPVECVKFNECYFIWNGHKRVSAALFNRVEFIPCKVIAKEADEIQKNLFGPEFAKAAFKMSWYYDWEDVHGFRFVKYPQLVPSLPAEAPVDATSQFPA